MAEKELISQAVNQAVNDFVNRISNEIDYMFRPRYTQLKGGQEQSNPFANLDETAQTYVITNGLTMVLAQMAAQVFVTDPKFPQEEIFAQMTRQLRQHADKYHQLFLQMREAEKHADRQNDRKDADRSNERAAPDLSDFRSESSGDEGR